MGIHWVEQLNRLPAFHDVKVYTHSAYLPIKYTPTLTKVGAMYQLVPSYGNVVLLMELMLIHIERPHVLIRLQIIRRHMVHSGVMVIGCWMTMTGS